MTHTADTEIPIWLQGLTIIGREGDEENAEEGQEEGEEEEEEGGEGDDEEQNKGSEEAPSEAEALRKALNEERKLRRQAERKARLAEKKQTKEEKQETEDLQQTQTELQTEREKNAKIAARLLNKERDDAIKEVARKMQFIDPTDALTDEIRKAVEIDQDPDDPSDIEVDMDSVKLAVQKLANAKKHLLGKPNDGEPSASSFNSKRKKSGGDQKTSEAQLHELYPSLR